MRKTSLALKLSLAILTFASLTTILLAHPKIANAAGSSCNAGSNGTPGESYPSCLGGIQGDVSVEGSQATTENPENWFDITYPIDNSNPNATISVTVKTNYNCSVEGLGFDLIVLNRKTQAASTMDYTSCTGNPGSTSITFNMPVGGGGSGGNAFNEGNDGIASEYVAIDASNSNGNGGHIAYSLSVQGGSQDNLWISYAGEDSPNYLESEANPPGSQTWPSDGSDRQFSFYTGNVTFQMQAPCNISPGTNVYFKWNGVDFGDTGGPPAQGTNVTVTIKDLTTSYSWTGPPSASVYGDVFHDPDIYSSPGVPVNPGDHLEMSWNNVSGSNEIGVSLPFSANSLDDGVVCQSSKPSWTLTPSSTVNVHSAAPGQTVTFSQTATESSSAGDGMEVGWNARLVSATSSLDWTTYQSESALSYQGSKTINKNFTIPNDATNGEQFCEKLDVYPSSETNGNIDNTYSESNGACVTVNYNANPPPGHGPEITGNCTGANFNLGSGADFNNSTSEDESSDWSGEWASNGTTGVKWALYETADGIPPGAGSGWASGGWTPQTVLTNSSAEPPLYADSGPGGAQIYPVRDGSDYNSSGVDEGYPINDDAADSVHNMNLSQSELRQGNIEWYLITYDTATATWTQGGHSHTMHESFINGIATSTASCFSSTANCNLSVTGADLGATNMEGGQEFTISASMTNTGSQTLDDPLSDTVDIPLDLVITYNGQTYEEDVGDSLVPGQTSQTVSIPVTAPADVAEHDVGCTAEYPGLFILGPTNAAPVDDYEYFSIGATPTAQLDYQEDPSNVAKSYTVANSTPWAAPSKVDNYLTFTPSGQTVANEVEDDPQPSTLYNPAQTWAYTYPIPADHAQHYAVAGDNYCPISNVSPNTGWVGPDYNELDTTNYTFDGICDVVHNDPTYKVYDSSTSAGGSFDNTCSSAGVLEGWNNNTNTNFDYGSSTQFASTSLGQIIGFAGNQDVNDGTKPTTGLTFANTGTGAGNISSDTYSPSLGGDSGGSKCLTDLSPNDGANVSNNPSDTDSVSFENASEGAGKYVVNYTDTSLETPFNGLQLGGGVVSSGHNLAMFVDGNVYITGNIVYGGDNGVNGTSAAAWTSTANVPSFTLHATGNIYISPGVTELDGDYISDGTVASNENSIYTCGAADDSFQPMAATALYSGCNNQLTVYGSFEADNVDLMRTFGSLRDDSTVSDTTCSNEGERMVQSTCAAEVFYGTPEMYVATPPVTKGTDDVEPQIQAITSLPPVL
jgi:hypothetical protein